MTTSDNNQRTQELLAQEGLESIGQKLFNTINDLTGKPQSARRWIWELLQNAKDVIDENGKVEVNLSETYVEFSHNGSPFLHDHLLAILSQRSTKPPSYSDEMKQNFFDKLFSDQEVAPEEAKEFLNTTGKFGTGFMTTYLLSKKISLESIYRSNGTVKTFQLPLDREAATPDEMKEKVKESFSTFTQLEKEQISDNNISNHQDGLKCDTKFIYQFDADGKTVAEHGIADMHNSIPFVFSFVPKLKTVLITEHGNQTTYVRLTPKSFGEIIIERIEKQTTDGKHTIEIAKLSAKYEALTIATTVESVGDNKYRIIFPNESTPRQFISFPLVGSESFSFPLIIHSPLFNPDDLRSHVFLNLSNHHGFDKKVQLNRELFEKAIDLFKQFLKIASENAWENLHYLAKSDLPKDVTDDWYKNNIQQEIRKEILEAEIVVTESQKRIKPKEAKFPIYRTTKLDEFWELCKFLISEKIPRKQDVQIWKDIIEANTKNWLGADFDFDLEKLLLLIQNEISFSAFVKTYFSEETKAFEALNKILRFTEDEDKELLNRKEKPMVVFPNQTNDSTFTVKKELSIDSNIPKQIKDIMKSVGENWYKKLVRDEITVFERESKLTVKIASDRIKEKVEKYYSSKLTEEEKALLRAGLFELSGYSTEVNKTEINTIHKFLLLYFPDKVSKSNEVILGVEDFDWNPFQKWAIRNILYKVSNFETLDNLSLHLTNTNYPELKESYTREEEDLKFKVDTSLNEIIQFVFQYDKTLLAEFGVIPNQLNQLCKFSNEIFNDDSIPKELKNILNDFGADCRKSLLHSGVTVALNESRDLKWVCGQLDDLAIKEKNNEGFKQPIRELDKWISKQKESITDMDHLFKSFYRQRSGIVLNTYDLEERDQFDEILKSGMSADLASIVKSGTTAATIKEVANILKGHPELTAERIERLFELEEMSKGWDTTVDQPTDDKVVRTNFENGWKGEAFVYKKLKEKNYSIQWANKTETDNGNSIIDFEGEQHFIIDKGDKYDLIAQNSEGHNIYIQVKATTTDISRADTIALPISTREWKFVFETTDTESFYLARVFNVNSNTPEVYFMKLRKPLEL